MKYCRYCGKPIDDDSTFCTHCGKGQSVQNNYISVEKFGDIVSRVWSKTKNLKTKFVFPKGNSNTTFVRIKKWIKRIVIILIVATILGLFVLLGFWLYGFYLTSKWTREDERREIISLKDISKADSIVRVLFQEYADGTHRYDFQFENKRGYKTTVEGLSEKFNKEYWNYAKLISGVLRYRMPLERVLKLVSSLQLGDENINTWKSGVERALKKYVRDSDTSGNVCPHCGQSSVVHQEGIAICSCCGLSSTE